VMVENRKWAELAQQNLLKMGSQLGWEKRVRSVTDGKWVLTCSWLSFRFFSPVVDVLLFQPCQAIWSERGKHRIAPESMTHHDSPTIKKERVASLDEWNLMKSERNPKEHELTEWCKELCSHDFWNPKVMLWNPNATKLAYLYIKIIYFKI
jgi:hypothetical protein